VHEIGHNLIIFLVHDMYTADLICVKPLRYPAAFDIFLNQKVFALSFWFWF